MVKEEKKGKYSNSKTEQKFCLNCQNRGLKIDKRGYPDFLVYRIDKKMNEFAFCFVEVKKGKQKLKNKQRWIFTILKHYGVPIYLLKDGNIPPESHLRVIPYKEFKKSVKQLKTL